MSEAVALILAAGRSAVELALYVLLPIMVVMLSLMRLLEARGWIDRLLALLTPLLRPLGLPGLGVFAMLQILLVSFAAPVATLAMMQRGETSARHIAATLAMVLTLAQANVVLPMAARGLDILVVMGVSLIFGLLAAALCFYGFGRHLTHEETPTPAPRHPAAEDAKGVLDVINRAGAEAFKIAIGALPILILALVLVHALEASGVAAWVQGLLAPLFAALGLSDAALMPLLSKYLAGGTAMMGVANEQLLAGVLSPREFNALAGLLIHPLDLVGVAVLISAGPRVAAVLRPALYAAMVALILRAAMHLLLY